MTKLLEKAVEKLERLPARSQNNYASIIFDELLSEARWSRLFTATSDKRQRNMEKAVLGEIKRGVKPLKLFLRIWWSAAQLKVSNSFLINCRYQYRNAFAGVFLFGLKIHFIPVCFLRKFSKERVSGQFVLQKTTEPSVILKAAVCTGFGSATTMIMSGCCLNCN